LNTRVSGAADLPSGVTGERVLAEYRVCGRAARLRLCGARCAEQQEKCDANREDSPHGRQRSEKIGDL
jgi:hypothetical protein